MAEPSRWERERLSWVKSLTPEDVMRIVAEINANSGLDENEGDRAERREAIEWMLSCGERGYDWGIPPTYAEPLGLWPFGGAPS